MYNQLRRTIKTRVLMSVIITLIACGGLGVLSKQANAEHDNHLLGAMVDKSYPEPLVGKIYVGHSFYTTISGKRYPAEMFINIKRTERYIALFDQTGQELIVIKKLINGKWENIWSTERLRKENRKKDNQPN